MEPVTVGIEASEEASVVVVVTTPSKTPAI
jgi:hypothetical protein